MKEINSEKVPIKMWLNEIEDGAMRQAINLANLPFAHQHVALMPDTHEGFGMPIGGVLATKGVIIPNAVGVDIGCGMCAVRTSLSEIDTKIFRKGIMSDIRGLVPLGFKHHKRRKNASLLPSTASIPVGGIVEQQFESARKQIGTLGGGNHFIEIQKGDDGFIWVMVHSGSRNLGYKIAEHYNKLAKKINEENKFPIPEKWDLAFLSLNTKAADDYILEMQYSIDFALASRKMMIENVIHAMHDNISSGFEVFPMINIAHNYASEETHFGQKVFVHRKGATQAKEGQVGIIPGSQGTASYIVSGKGNPESFQSCSHGAGRRLGRRQAQRELNLEDEIKALDKKNIIHSIRSKRDLDEAPSAYKDISEVMANQTDLVEILTELRPLAVIKG